MNRNKFKVLQRLVRLTVLFMVLATCSVWAEPREFASGNHKVALLELYTSQGCSSCPPAEKWLSQFRAYDGLWQQLVPVALHVDYWDYIGWPDPFADKRFSARQRAYRDAGGTRRVYTPGIVYDGAEWRGLFESAPPLKNRLDVLAKQSAPELVFSTIDGNFAAKLVGDANDSDELTIHIVLFGFDIVTRVKKGENKGRSIRQDFVALAYHTQLSRDKSWAGLLPSAKNSESVGAIAVWITHAGDPAPIQVLGGWL